MLKCKKRNIIVNKPFKYSQSKGLLWEIIKELDKNFILLDKGSDWLKIWFSRLGKDFESLYNSTLKSLEEKSFMSSTSWNSLYNYDIFWDKFDIDVYKSPVGLTFKFSKSVDIYWITQNVSLFSLAVMQNNNFNLDENIILNVFGLAFQLHKLHIINLNQILSNFPFGKTTRLDWNFNYVVPEDYSINDIISKIWNRFKLSKKRFRNFYDETLIYNLYENSWVDKKKKKKRLRMTSRVGLRIYNKSKELYDDRIQGFYPQYHWKNILRFEFVLGSQYLNWFWFKKDYFTVEEIFNIWVKKIFWDYPFQEFKEKELFNFSTEYYESLLKRNKKDLESRLEWFIQRGWDLKEIIINWKNLKDLLLEENN